MQALSSRCWLAIMLLAMVAITVGACGSGRLEHPESAATLPASAADSSAILEQITLAPAPPGVDAALWQRLTSELARQVGLARGSKATATPPSGQRSAVSDLHLVPGSSAMQLEWTHRSTGDYDRNGEVNISDLTPIGVHFGATPASWGWDAAQTADGDANGEINISDITPIGLNYLSRTTAYHVYGGNLEDYPPAPDAANGPAARLVGTVDIADFTAVACGRQLTLEVAAPMPGELYWVRPFDGATDGVTSNCVAPQLRGDWWMQGREPKHQGRSAFPGPRDNHLAWTYASGAENTASPIVRGDGTVYFGSEDGSLHAVNPDGSPAWSYATGDEIWATPAIGASGRVYFGSLDNYIYAINPDGSLGWRVDLGSHVYSPTIGPNEEIYVGTHDGLVAAVDPAGALDWSLPTAGDVRGSPAIGADGVVYATNYAGELYAINPDGSERWHFTTGGAIRFSPSIADDGTLYLGNDDGYVYALTPEGAEVWRYNAGSSVESGLAIGADGAIYFGGLNGFLTAIETDGSLRWQYDIRSALYGSPVIGADGIIYCTCMHGAIQAINPDGTLHWEFYTTGSGHGLALASGGTLYVCTTGNALLAFTGGLDGTAAGVEEIVPVEGLTGTQIAPRAMTLGTPPFNFSWDFGGGATPNTSSDASPTITLGAAGVYPASVSVASSYGPPAVYDFILYSYPPSAGAGGWVHALGGNRDDAFDTLAVAADGSVYAAGFTCVPGYPDYAGLISRYSPAGELLDTIIYQSSQPCLLFAMAIGPTGDMYCVGETRNSENYGDDILLLRFSSSLEPVWQQAWDSGGWDYCEALLVNPDGGVTLAGAADNGEDEDMVLLSWDPAGLFAGGWQYNLADEEAYCAASDDSGLYLGGAVEGAGEGDRDALLLKLNPDASVAWAVTYGTTDYEALYGMQLDAAGNAYVTGSDAMVCRFSSAGTLDWANSWNGGQTQLFSDIVLDGTSVYVAGEDWTSGFGDDIAVTCGDTTGAVMWCQLWQAAFPDDYVSDLLIHTNGAIYLSGGGVHAYGSWLDVAVSAAPLPWVLHDVTPVRTAVSTLPYEVTGSVENISLVQDVGGGAEDALIFSWDFSD